MDSVVCRITLESDEELVAESYLDRDVPASLDVDNADDVRGAEHAMLPEVYWFSGPRLAVAWYPDTGACDLYDAQDLESGVRQMAEDVAINADGWIMPEVFAAYGYDPVRAGILTAAPEDYAGECAIWDVPQYYAGTYNAPQPAFWRSDDPDTVQVYPTRAKAQSAVDDYYNAPSGYDGIRACNVLSHGQAGADVLTVVIWDN